MKSKWLGMGRPRRTRRRGSTVETGDDDGRRGGEDARGSEFRRRVDSVRANARARTRERRRDSIRPEEVKKCPTV